MPQVSFSSDRIDPQTFIAEELTDKTLLPGGAIVNPAEFLAPDGVKVTVATTAVADAGSITVATLARGDSRTGVAIPAGAILNFNGSKQFAKVTAAANVGANALTVENIPANIPANQVATYAGVGSVKPIPAGVAIGRTFAERANGVPFGAAAISDDEIFLIGVGTPDAMINPQVVPLRPGILIYEDKIPGWSGFSGAMQTKLREIYQCILSARV